MTCYKLHWSKMKQQKRNLKQNRLIDWSNDSNNDNNDNDLQTTFNQTQSWRHALNNQVRILFVTVLCAVIRQ